MKRSVEWIPGGQLGHFLNGFCLLLAPLASPHLWAHFTLVRHTLAFLSSIDDQRRSLVHEVLVGVSVLLVLFLLMFSVGFARQFFQLFLQMLHKLMYGQ